MDLTCPELVNVTTSDYGSRETSTTEEVNIEGFCTMFTTIGGKGEICQPDKSHNNCMTTN